MDTNEKVMRMMAGTTKKLIEFCYKNKINNPKIDISINVTNGEKYKLVFERIDLDEILNDPAGPQGNDH